MIKILRHGHPTKYIADCDECNAQIEFTQQDIQCTKGQLMLFVPIVVIILKRNISQ